MLLEYFSLITYGVKTCAGDEVWKKCFCLHFLFFFNLFAWMQSIWWPCMPLWKLLCARRGIHTVLYAHKLYVRCPLALLWTNAHAYRKLFYLLCIYDALWREDLLLLYIVIYTFIVSVFVQRETDFNKRNNFTNIHTRWHCQLTEGWLRSYFTMHLYLHYIYV